MLISEEYRRLNEELHSRTKYGARGDRHARNVMQFAGELGARTVLDYGCGRGRLARSIKLPCRCYDPAVPRFASDPPPCDLVVCTDVLEHVEPEYLDNVLAHIESKTVLGAFFAIALRYDRTKLLADGSNPHRIVETPQFWIDRFANRGWSIHRVETDHDYEIKLWMGRNDESSS